MVNLPLLVERTYGFCPGSFTPGSMNSLEANSRIYCFDVELFKVPAIVNFLSNFISLVFMVCCYSDFSPFVRGVMYCIIPKNVTMTI